MAKEKTVIKAKGTNSAYNVKANGVVTIKIKFDASMLFRVLELIPLMAENITLGAVLNKRKIKVGLVNFWDFKVDRDGETVVQFRTDTADINLPNLMALYEEELIDFVLIA